MSAGVSIGEQLRDLYARQQEEFSQAYSALMNSNNADRNIADAKTRLAAQYIARFTPQIIAHISSLGDCLGFAPPDPETKCTATEDGSAPKKDQALQEGTIEDSFRRTPLAHRTSNVFVC